MNSDFDPATKSDIHAKALELRLHPWFRDTGVEDIEQDLSFDLLRRRPGFNPDAGDWTMFSRAVLRNKGASMIKHRRRLNEAMRRRERSLGEIVEKEDDGAPVTLAETITDGRPSAIDAACLKHDVETLTAKLPPRLRRAAELLKTHSQAKAAAEMGMSRTMFRERCLIPLQKAFRSLA